MTVTVSFDTPQIQVSNSSNGIQLSQVILPYSIRSSENFGQYLGGQMTLGQSDGIKLTDNTKDWERLGLAKIKNMVADAEIYVPDPIIEVPEELPASSATEVSVSSADDSVASSVAETPASSASTVASSEATVASSEATVASSSVETSVSSASARVTTTSSESTTEE
ncbi:hypothetical protein [Weissella confusa]|uniref:hypothetical protein n=1 Tax=Weissella confusa TaxID=1583 RepID=UPI0018F1174A|nr:hypothetical protein [Weissella confusa]MBJ7690623.1 hypothetical protein [Weissella confusa]MBJ7701783.1 hypothetical protein [Weissella confusa]